jgi:hypothetical protein
MSMKTNEFAVAGDAYRAEQIRLNEQKLEKIWATLPSMERLATFLKPRNPRFGICHGSRNLFEVMELRKRLPGCDVIGTDISPTVEQFGGIQHDFHDRNDEWIGKADFIYSNAWDHAHTLELCIDRWVEQLAPGGVVLLHHSKGHTYGSGGDCTSATLKELAAFAGKKHLALKPIYAGNNSERWPRGSQLGRLRDRVETILGINSEWFLPVQSRK